MSKKNKKILGEEKRVQIALGVYYPTYEQMFEDPEGTVYVTGTHMGIEYRIERGPTAPTAYVRIPGNSKYAKYAHNLYDEVDIDVHGGLTYGEYDPKRKCGWFGWDYAHPNDKNFIHMAMKKRIGIIARGMEIEHLFPEIIRDCERACEQLKVMLDKEILE